jgi:nitrate reductase NapD
MPIAGVVVYARPGHIRAVEQAVSVQPGVEVHAVSEDGKLVVTIEGESRGEVADMIYKLDRLDGVMNAAMVYEHSEYDPKHLEASQ